MINSITYNELIKTLRTNVIKQGELSAQYVRNADSVRGADLTVILSEINVMSAKLSDVFVIFELLEDDNDDNYIIPEENDTISSISSFKFVLHIYGLQSHMCAQMLMTRFKTSEVASALRDNGIYLAGIGFPTNTKEFINNTLWPRCDLEMDIKVRFNISKLKEYDAGYFNENIKDVDLIIEKL